MQKSAGILLYRRRENIPEILLVHPGDPFWKNKDEGAWTIPKAEFVAEEQALETARKAFKQIIGCNPEGNFRELQPVKQLGNKVTYAWALERDLDTDGVFYNTVEMDWSPGSGKEQAFSRIDKVQWFKPAEAKIKINPPQLPLIKQLLSAMHRAGNDGVDKPVHSKG